jgi:pimeloyl-ACP methyl ester carboxylesterase
MQRLVPLGLAALLAAGCVTSTGSAPADPVVRDPEIVDEAHPPRLDEVGFESGGARLHGIVYVAQGAGPHPTVILLHGLPGNERNLDLAQALRRDGWNVVFFHYRGAWGSEGAFSFAHVMEDVEAVVGRVREPDFAARHRVDPARIALVGHSMGGFAALTVGRELDAVTCIVSMAGANLGAVGALTARDPARAEALAGAFEAWGGPFGSPDPQALVAELQEGAERFDPTLHATALARKPVLLVAGELDATTPLGDHHVPLVQALADQEDPKAEHAVLGGADHAFSARRILLARLVSGWLDRSCRAEAPESAD